MTTDRQHDAKRLNAEGHAHADRGDDAAALRAYTAAAEAAPDWSIPWFNLGLVYKYAGRWREAIAANEQALARQPDHQGSLWNLGIAATAVADWKLAREAWKKFGIAVPDGEGPIDAKFGLTPIRVDTKGNPEVIWAHRVDPCRGVIASIPFRQSGRRYKDVILHDGAPNGTRRLGDVEVPVFDELERLESSTWDTFELEVTYPEGALSLLQDLAREDGGNAEDWTANTRIMCKACSEGRPDHSPEHDHSGNVAEGAHRVAIAARDREHAAQLLVAWQSEVDGIEIHWLDDGFATECE